MIVGRQDTVHLQADSVSCVDAIMLKDPGGKELKVDWKATRPDEVEMKLPLAGFEPGAMTLLVTQYGVTNRNLSRFTPLPTPGEWRASLFTPAIRRAS